MTELLTKNSITLQNLQGLRPLELCKINEFLLPQPLKSLNFTNSTSSLTIQINLNPCKINQSYNFTRYPTLQNQLKPHKINLTHKILYESSSQIPILSSQHCLSLWMLDDCQRFFVQDFQKDIFPSSIYPQLSKFMSIRKNLCIAYIKTVRPSNFQNAISCWPFNKNHK